MRARMRLGEKLAGHSDGQASSRTTCRMAMRFVQLRHWRLASLFAFGVLFGVMVGSLVAVHRSPFLRASCDAAAPFRRQEAEANIAQEMLPNADQRAEFDEHDSLFDGAHDQEEPVIGNDVRKLAVHDTESNRRSKPDTNAEANQQAGASVQEEKEVEAERIRQFIPETIRPKKLVLIGVMTTAKFVDTRAVAGFQTWGVRFPHLIYFSSEGTVSRHGLPVVGLKDIDDEYPPQRKAFAMLRYMATHFGDEYEFFMRLDDDVYVRTERLQRVLFMLGKGADLYIGQPGEGNKEEKGTLDVTSWRYCMGGPGVIYSRSVLKKLRPHVDYCLTNLMQSTHEDVEVGRCLHDRLGVSCSWNVEMQRLFYHGFKPSMIFSSRVYSPDLRFAVTVHPLKDPRLVYRLHDFYLGHEHLQKELSYEELNRTLAEALTLLNSRSPQAVATRLHLQRETRRRLAAQHPYRVACNSSAASGNMYLDTFSPYLYYSTRQASRPVRDFKGQPFRFGLKKILGRLMYQINLANAAKKILKRYARLNEGYMSADPVLGYHMVADSILLTSGGSNIPDENTEMVELWQPMQAVVVSKQRASMSQREARVRVNILVTVAARRAARFDGFLRTLRAEVLDGHPAEAGQIQLIVVLFRQRIKVGGLSMNEANAAVEKVRNSLKLLKVKQPRLIMTLDVKPGKVSASVAIHTALGHLDASVVDGGLIMTVDESVRFRAGLLRRCRLNAVAKNAIFFPSVFGLFDAGVVARQQQREDGDRRHEDWTVAAERGLWLPDYYGVGCFHAADLAVNDGLLKTPPLWEEEEMALFVNDFLAEGMEVVRGPDPDVFRHYVAVTCRPMSNPKLVEKCQLLSQSRVATQSQLIRALHDHPLVQDKWTDQWESLPQQAEIQQ